MEDSGIKAYKLDNGVTANNVLSFAIGELVEVSLVGRHKNGEYYYASSIEDPRMVLTDLKHFKSLLENGHYE